MRVHWALSRARATHILLRIWNVNSCCGESRIGWESGSITIISLSESSLFFSSLYLSDPVTDCMLSYHGGLCSFSPVWHISCLLAQPPLTRSAPPSLWPLPGPMNQNPLGPLAADIHGDPYHFFLFFFFYWTYPYTTPANGPTSWQRKTALRFMQWLSKFINKQWQTFPNWELK